jgi:glucose/arabinose dehydrogenase
MMLLSRVPRPIVMVTASMFCLALAGCGAASTSKPSSPEDVSDGKPTVVIDGLSGPTQFQRGEGASFIVAQLNGEEDASTGQIVVVDPSAKEAKPTVVLDALDKPTGVAWADDELYVMVKRGLISVPWSGEPAPIASAPRVILDGLPYNGRSQGTLAALDDGRLLYETTGNLIGATADTGTVEAGSGTLFSLDRRELTAQAPGDDPESQVIARGTKHAYSHAVFGDLLLTTEIGDGPGAPPPDELNAIPLAPSGTDGDQAPDLGWPRCPSDRALDKPGCSSVIDPVAIFEANSTPTSVVVVDNTAYVALFVSGTIVSIDIADWKPGDPPRAITTVVSGLQGPHTLMAEPDGSLLVSEHLANRIVRVRP